MRIVDRALSFVLPPELEAHEPPEARGLERDQVRLMVSYKQDNRTIHAQFRDLPTFLNPGDVVVINTSGTLPAALPAIAENRTELRLHLSTRLPGGLWTAELRRPEGGTTKPFLEGRVGEILHLPLGALARLLKPYRMEVSADAGITRPTPSRKEAGIRLWITDLEFPPDVSSIHYLIEHGQPIRYSYVPQHWPIDCYQTVYATEMGSAEMPSAGRAFTPEMITRLVANGVQVVPLILHTGVASLEDHEPPYAEYYRVPPETAHAVNQAKLEGRRVIAIGTTAVRALETVTNSTGTHPGEGWTEVFITPQRGVCAVDGILTGWHEPKATHLMMLEAIAGREHLALAYQAAFAQRYLWHEFGDLHLILP